MEHTLDPQFNMMYGGAVCKASKNFPERPPVLLKQARLYFYSGLYQGYGVPPQFRDTLRVQVTTVPAGTDQRKKVKTWRTVTVSGTLNMRKGTN